MMDLEEIILTIVCFVLLFDIFRQLSIEFLSLLSDKMVFS